MVIATFSSGVAMGFFFGTTSTTIRIGFGHRSTHKLAWRCSWFGSLHFQRCNAICQGMRDVLQWGGMVLRRGVQRIYIVIPMHEPTVG
jgi:hypothetical protein